MSEASILSVTLGPTPASASAQTPVGVGSTGVFNIVLPKKTPEAIKGAGRGASSRQGRGPQDPLARSVPAAGPGNSRRKPGHDPAGLDCPLPVRSVGILYVGRTEGEQATVLGKVGMSQDRTTVFKRAASFQESDRIFEFVLEAAFEVSLPAGTVMKRVEDAVLNELEQGGLKRFGENFLVPGGHMPFLANLAAKALTRLGHTFVPLDIEAHRQGAIQHNSETWAKLRSQPSEETKDIYQAWLLDHCSPPNSWAGIQRHSQSLRGFLALGYLLRDLAAGSGLQRLEVPLPDKGTLVVFPSSLTAAQFEYQAEVDLHLASAESFQARVLSLDQLPHSPISLSVILGCSLEPIDLPNAFILPSEAQPDLARFTPEHVAALGLLGGRYGEACLWEGLGVRAKMPIHLHRTVLANPELLPAFRFWIGLKHFSRQHFRLWDFPLPLWAETLWDDRLIQAAWLLEEAGFSVPESEQDYVVHAWIPGQRGHFVQTEKWVV